jgi:hypothetical protein
MKSEIFDVGFVGIVSGDASVPAFYSDGAAAARPAPHD